MSETLEPHTGEKPQRFSAIGAAPQTHAPVVPHASDRR